MTLKIFESIEARDNKVYLDGKEVSAKIGKHSIYLDELKIKVMWSHNGKVEPIRDFELGKNWNELKIGVFNNESDGLWDKETIYSLLSEYSMFDKLSKLNMSPHVGDFVYIKNATSNMPFFATHCDPIGLYGFEFENANVLKTGAFSTDKMRRFLTENRIECSDHAFADLTNNDNVINGYCVDLRRTIWDMILFNKIDEKYSLPYYRQDKHELIEKIKFYSQFPHKKRAKNYQTYLLGNEYQDGSRDTAYRMDQMGIAHDLTGNTVLDLGCNLGAMCVESYRRGARLVSGIDYEQDYIDCARDLARYNGNQINFLRMDLTKESTIDWVNAYYPNGVDIVFALSLFKHIKSKLFDLLQNIKFGRCIVESNNSPDGEQSDHAKQIISYFNHYGFKYDFFGMTDDRSPRCLWVVKK